MPRFQLKKEIIKDLKEKVELHDAIQEMVEEKLAENLGYDIYDEDSTKENDSIITKIAKDFHLLYRRNLTAYKIAYFHFRSKNMLFKRGQRFTEQLIL